MARRKNRGASFAGRKTDEAQAEIRKKEQQTTLLYSALGIAALLAMCAIIYLIYRPSSGSTAETTTASESAESAIAAEGSQLAADDDGVDGISPTERNGYYSAAPDMVIDPSKSYQALVKTEKGDMRFQLYADVTPLTVNNFVFLSQQGFYNDTMFHRVIPDFMAQGGDPTGTGTGGPGYTFEDEVDNDLSFDRRGLLAMANAGPATNGSQFFITFVPTPHLNGNHTIFGELIEGDDVLSSIRIRDPQESEPGDIITSIEIFEN